MYFFDQSFDVKYGAKDRVISVSPVPMFISDLVIAFVFQKDEIFHYVRLYTFRK